MLPPQRPSLYPSCLARMEPGGRGQPALGWERRCTTAVIKFSARRPSSFAAAYVIGIELMVCLAVGPPTVPHVPGRDTVHNLASVILNEGRRHG